uniref:Uncharacterized protein n=1 Tax=Anguilla anguilla TaxID=7936 RepID=A0A0E9UCF6_ANGAN
MLKNPTGSGPPLSMEDLGLNFPVSAPLPKCMASLLWT